MTASLLERPTAANRTRTRLRRLVGAGPTPRPRALSPKVRLVIAAALALAAAARAVQPQGWVYLEAPTAWDDAALVDAGLAPHRHLKAGAVHAHLLRPCA